MALAAAAPPDTPVQVQMRNVALHVDADTILSIRQLRGELISTHPGAPPVFDDKNSFVVRIDSAEIAITDAGLSQLLNRYVFAYDGSPLRHLDVTTEGRQLKVKGTIKKGVDVPFTIVADPRVDESGNLRLKPASIKALGLPAAGLMSFFGLEMDKLVKVKPGHGVKIDGNDFVLIPSGLLPPPKIEGRLQSIRVEQGTVVQIFGPGKAAPLQPPEPKTNYMYYRGGLLRFGKLTMTDTDLFIQDGDERDPFDVLLTEYNKQLVAGYTRNKPNYGLHTFMVDYAKLGKVQLTQPVGSGPAPDSADALQRRLSSSSR